jgi:hypothetical protein
VIGEKWHFPVSRFEEGGMCGKHGTFGTFSQIQLFRTVYFWNIDGTLYRWSNGTFSLL